MHAYSQDLRQRVLAKCDAGISSDEVARLFDVSPAWVRRLKQRRRELNTIAPLPRRYGPHPRFTSAHEEELKALVAQQPDATLKELQARLSVKVHVSRICRALKKLELTFKKSPPCLRAGPGRCRRGTGDLAHDPRGCRHKAAGVPG
jgi:transposase